MTLAEVEKKFIQELLNLYDQEEAKTLATLAITHVCELTRGQMLAKKQEPLSDMNETSLSLILEELKTGKPLQYVLGETEFYGLRFKVNPSVLIPRPETEELVEWVLDVVKNQKLQTNSILDIGTGSGCIPVALKKNLPDVKVSALDISHPALETAIKNAILNNVDVNFFQADILVSHISHPTSQYSIIVSNPPYIARKEERQMHSNVLQHEPHTALFVPDESPLIFYDKISDFAFTHLEPGGLLFFEINENLGEETVLLLEHKGFKNIELRQDIRGKDRMIRAGL